MIEALSRSAMDIFNPAHRADPYPIYKEVRDAGPLHELSPRTSVVMRLKDCATILKDDRWGHGYPDKINPFRPGVGSDEVTGSLLTMDPPDHTRLRRLVGKAFTARTIAAMRARTEKIAGDLLDAAMEKNDVDLISAFADLLPLTVICETVGVPRADYPIFKDWSTAIIRGVDPDYRLTPEEITGRYVAQAAFEDYFRALVEERRGNHRGDLLSDLVAIEEAGDAMSEHELLEIGSTLMVAGHETTVNGLGNAVLSIYRHPDQLALLRKDPALIPSAVDEALRYDSPIQFTSRVALEKLEFLGRTFERGQGVVVMIGSANRDPGAFTDPDRFDVTRYHRQEPAVRHLTFSSGPHHCLGAQLARMEMDVALRALIERAPQLTLLTDAPVYRDLFLFRGPLHLPVRMHS